MPTCLTEIHFFHCHAEPCFPHEQLRLFTMMKRKCGVKQTLWTCWFRLQNDIKTRWGDSKNEIGFDVYEHVVVHDLGSIYDS